MNDKDLEGYEVVCSDKYQFCHMFDYNGESLDHSCNLGCEIREFDEEELVGTKLEGSVKWPSELVLSKSCKLKKYVLVGGEIKTPVKTIYKADKIKKTQ